MKITNIALLHKLKRFYENVSKVIKEYSSEYEIVIGDFNAKLGKKQDDKEKKVGNFGYDSRNDRGEILYNFLEQENLYAINTFFKRKPQNKWTWIIPSGSIKNEIDHVLSKNKNIIKGTGVLNTFATGSDHRMLRTKIQINIKINRLKKIKTIRFI